jgi:hypothetical protein
VKGGQILADLTQFILSFIHSAQPVVEPIGYSYSYYKSQPLATQWPMSPTDLSIRLKPIARRYTRQQTLVDLVDQGFSLF